MPYSLEEILGDLGEWAGIELEATIMASQNSSPSVHSHCLNGNFLYVLIRKANLTVVEGWKIF